MFTLDENLELDLNKYFFPIINYFYFYFKFIVFIFVYKKKK